MKAVVYARFSTDMQRDASIDDQRRNCERHATREGWQVTELYEDKGISGTRSDRPGYQRMLTDAKARAFDVLLVDDLSRLARDSVENEQTLRLLEHWGVRIIGVCDGYDSASKARKMQRGMRGLFNELYIDDLREKTHRGLTGQALKGNNCGGRAFGYRHMPIEDHKRLDPYGRPTVTAVKREIDPEQAEIVRQIFNWYADGFSPRWIADELNKQGIPSPGAIWKRKERRNDGKWLASAIHGDPRKGVGLLNNELYVGRFIWNRSTWVKNPETGRKERRERPESEWVITTDETLRIVPVILWDRVKARQAEGQAKSRAIQAALHKNARTGRGPKYLFSGLLKCAECGANFVISNALQYGCATNVNGGKHACSNTLRVARSLVESRLLEGIKRELFNPEVIAEFKREVARLLAEHKKTPDTTATRQKLVTIDRQIENMISAIKAGAFSEVLKAELDKAEAERKQLQAALNVNTRELDKVGDFLPRAMDRYRELVDDLGNATQRDVARARAQIKHLLGGEIRLVPTGDHLVAELAGDYAGFMKLAGEKANKINDKISVVAGVGFEPTTFGL